MPSGQKTTGTQQRQKLLASKWTVPVISALQHTTLRYSAIEKARFHVLLPFHRTQA